MSARDVMVTDVVAVRPTDTVGVAIQKMMDNDLAGLPVVDDEMRVVGQLTEVHLVSMVLPAYIERLEKVAFLPDEFRPFDELMRSATTTLVGDLMSEEFEAGTEDTSLPSLARRMVRPGVRRIFILRDGRLVGTVGRRDLFKVMLDRAVEETGQAPDELL